ncbi:stringent starvation protein A [Gammaproteobacteria bacterium]|nr:stringent starvation protein A [Gammaproteobacteria bacterium]
MITHPLTTTLYMLKNSLEADRVSIGMIEKHIAHDRCIVDISCPPEALLDFNPQMILPAFNSREAGIYFADIILEYINERHPYPSFYPNDPVMRSRFRLVLKKITQEWYLVMEKLILKKGKDKILIKQIQEIFLRSNSLFEGKYFFQDKDFMIVDAALAPLFHWSQIFNIEFPENAQEIQAYSLRVLARPSVCSLYQRK